MSKRIYAIQVEWHRWNGHEMVTVASSISGEAYESIKDALEFLASRTDMQSKSGMIGWKTLDGTKDQYREVFYIKELTVKEAK